uniref:Uncharacterized protein n=1 Tax=Oryza brachyantha TaxID=4533 RepID=J3MMQ0_ORYBR
MRWWRGYETNTPHYPHHQYVLGLDLTQRKKSGRGMGIARRKRGRAYTGEERACGSILNLNFGAAATTLYTTARTTEAAVDAMRIILRQCESSKTDDGGGGGYQDFINESCWSPLNLTYGFTNAHLDVITTYDASINPA